MIEDNKIYFFKVGKAQYIYGKDTTYDKNAPYFHMKYENSWVIDTGRKIFENTFPRKIAEFDLFTGKTKFKTAKDEYVWFKSESELFNALDEIASQNLNHIMWPLTPTNWIKPCEMKEPVGYKQI